MIARKTLKARTKRRVKFPGIAEDAETLGVSRYHLFKVLCGERHSRRLMKRYTQLKKERQEALPETVNTSSV